MTYTDIRQGFEVQGDIAPFDHFGYVKVLARFTTEDAAREYYNTQSVTGLVRVTTALDTATGEIATLSREVLDGVDSLTTA